MVESPAALKVVGLIEECIALTGPLLALSDSSTRPDEVYAMVAVAAGRELAEGVCAELRARRSANAMRLARHLMEHEHELHYVVDDPAPRLAQVNASHCLSRLKMAALIDAPLSDDLRRTMMDSLAQGAHQEEELKRLRAERRARIAGGAEEDPLPISAEGFLPTRRKIAVAIERESDYDVYYAWSSRIAHPGPLGGRHYARFEESGELLRVEAEGHHVGTSEQAGTLALLALVLLLDRVNWLTGAVSLIGAQLADIRSRA